MAQGNIYLKFVDANITGTITLYWENAPRTCEAIWGALEAPIQVSASHAMYSGPEIMTGLPEQARNFDPHAIPAENQTVFPESGELLWFYQAKNFFKGMPEEFWEIGMFYAPGGRTFGPIGWIPCNYFGRMTEGLDAIAEQCRLIRVEGIKTVEYGRLV